MNDVTSTLGYAIFDGIEKNEYLNEIYDALLHNDFLRLFKIDDIEPKDVPVEDALRFADLLSKSINTEHSEQHRSLAQEIVTLLDLLNPGNEDIQYVMGSVLSSASNYLGLQHSVPGFKEGNIFDRLSDEINREYLRIPSEENSYFLKSQKTVYDHMTEDSYFSYSGPTSMGKSFVMRTFIRERIKKSPDCNFAILVPTKALINEVSKEMADNLGDLLREHDYRIITSAGATILQEKNEHKYVFVMTPERMLYQLIGFKDIPIQYLFVDEAQNISDKEGRSAFYYQVVGILNRSELRPHVIFASPHIPNPDIYLELIPSGIQGERSEMTSLFTPVSQEKFLIDLQKQKLGYYNGLTQELHSIYSFGYDLDFRSFISELGEGKKNLVYCNAKAKVVSFARKYADTLQPLKDKDLIALAAEIREQVHEDYFLADTVEKGVAYHVGYLPTSIRLRIEELFRKRDGGIHTIFCTSTLLEGVNLPADNLFITDHKNGSYPMSAVEFRNLIGRVGRIQYTLYGNVFLVCLADDDKTKPENYVTLLKKDVEPQTLSIVSISDKEKEYVLECLRKGQTKLEKLSDQTIEQFSLMRKAANILLREIMLDRLGRVRREFESKMTANDPVLIKEMFTGRKNEPDDDINVSVDQVDRVVAAIEAGLDYPKVNIYGYVGFQPTLQFLEGLCDAFDWETYESNTLGRVNKDGKHSNLRFYATLLTQWLTGNGIKYMIDQAISYKQGKNIYIDGESKPFDDGDEHRNKVIEDTLNNVNDIILFRLSNYFMRFSTELKKYHHRDYLPNDWYEYVEYGTTNKICILLQKNGFSPESATYIQKHEDLYIVRTDEGVKVLPTLLQCERSSVRDEAKTVHNNMPELFDE